MLIAGVALAGYLYERNRTGSIYHPHARFVPQPTPVLPKKGPDRFAWPLYGYTENHSRFFPAPAKVRPPFKTLWYHNTHALLEFPPVIYGERIFQLADDATLSAISKHTGHVFWTRKLGQLSASSPAVDREHGLRDDPLHGQLLRSGAGCSPEPGDGRDPLVARAARTERVLSPARRRPAVLRHPVRARVCAQRLQRKADLDLPGVRRGQGEPEPLRRRAVLRRLLRAPAGGLREQRQARSGSAHPKAPCSAAARSTRRPL